MHLAAAVTLETYWSANSWTAFVSIGRWEAGRDIQLDFGRTYLQVGASVLCLAFSSTQGALALHSPQAR
eukprot:3584101-Prymnesium_polylepis.1